MKTIRFWTITLSITVLIGLLPGGYTMARNAPVSLHAKSNVKENPEDKNKVPDYLLETTQRALDLINLLNRLDSARSQESVQRIMERMPILVTEAKKQKLPLFMIDVLETHLSNLPHTIGDGEYYEAVVMTNQIASILGTMISYYEPRIPFILGRMDYLLRDVYIQANFKDYDYALQRVQDIQSEWKAGLTDDIKNQGGSELIKRFEAGVNDLEPLLKQKNVQGVGNKVTELQQLIHSMEDLYRIKS